MINFKRQVALICKLLLQTTKIKSKKKKKSFALLAHEILQTSSKLVKEWMRFLLYIN